MTAEGTVIEFLGTLVQNLNFQTRRTFDEKVSPEDPFLTLDHKIELGWENGQAEIDTFVAANPDVVIDRTQLLIVKSGKGYPMDTGHGSVVYDYIGGGGEVETIDDENPIFGEVNYYTLFYKVNVTISASPMPSYPQEFYLNLISFPGLVYDPNWVVSQFNSKYKMAEPYEWADKFYSPDYLPDIYRTRDLQQDPDYPLRRYFRIMGLAFEHTWDMLDSHFQFNDPLTVDDDLLQLLGWNIGWIVNKELPLSKQRLEVRKAVRTYKRKGTKSGLIALIEGLSGWTVTVTKGHQNILYATVIDSDVIDITDSEVLSAMGTPDDTVDYIYGGEYVGFLVIIEIEATSDWELFNLVRDKIIRIIEQWLPVCCKAILETNLSGPTEAVKIGDSDHEHYLLTNNWLITDKDDKFTDDVLWRVQ